MVNDGVWQPRAADGRVIARQDHASTDAQYSVAVVPVVENKPKLPWHIGAFVTILGTFLTICYYFGYLFVTILLLFCCYFGYFFLLFRVHFRGDMIGDMITRWVACAPRIKKTSAGL